MVKVIQAYPKPVAQVICCNCTSVLEYGNADIHYQPENVLVGEFSVRLKGHYITCPICDNEVPVCHIERREVNE